MRSNSLMGENNHYLIIHNIKKNIKLEHKNMFLLRKEKRNKTEIITSSSLDKVCNKDSSKKLMLDNTRWEAS